MNVEQLKKYLAKITNTQKLVYINEKELEEKDLINEKMKKIN